MKRFPRMAFFVLALGFALASVGPVRADVGPVAVVEQFHAQLLTVMKEAKTLPIRKRFDQLASTMDKTFDFKRMIEVASSPDWRSAAAAQKTRLLDAFRRLSAATYATEFNGYSGEKFETVGQRPGPQNTVLVQTRIVETSGSDVGLTYVVMHESEGWRIADILLDNSISQLAVRRSEYRRILRDSGISGLINTLNKKADQLLAK